MLVRVGAAIRCAGVEALRSRERDADVEALRSRELDAGVEALHPEADWSWTRRGCPTPGWRVPCLTRTSWIATVDLLDCS